MPISINGQVESPVTSPTSPAGREIDLATESSAVVLVAGFISVDLIDAADVGGGGTTQTVGFQLRDTDGNPLAQETILQFAVFDDANVSSPAANATLGTPSAGVIAHGAGSAALVVKTNAAGLFTCTLTNPFTSTTVYLACAPHFASPPYQEIDSVAFTP